MKPTLNLYAKWKCVAVEEDEAEDWRWEIVLEDPKDPERRVSIKNRSRDEVFIPSEIVSGVLMTVSLSLRDTTLHFQMPNGHRQVVSLKPTQYAISDPKYGGDVFPQWPEELEERGITSHPDDEASAQPSEEWPQERERLLDKQDERRQQEATEFLQEDEREA